MKCFFINLGLEVSSREKKMIPIVSVNRALNVKENTLDAELVAK
jgi:hypothetical protein